MEEEGAEVEDRIQNSLIARFFEVNQNWLNLTPCAKKKKNTLWYKHSKQHFGVS